MTPSIQAYVNRNIDSVHQGRIDVDSVHSADRSVHCLQRHGCFLQRLSLRLLRSLLHHPHLPPQVLLAAAGAFNTYPLLIKLKNLRQIILRVIDADRSKSVSSQTPLCRLLAAGLARNGQRLKQIPALFELGASHRFRIDSEAYLVAGIERSDVLKEYSITPNLTYRV
ncbi:hypothetical protein Baya_11703 [Bagarius yarrelli]|uniref:Uncharacterized protein n=1 Tax=Bagarius yarrelli TaxID=175774 RepID=A0A556V1A2_BAGYA|nr:hypothetical protein Baya_11703 [Bagarius yarrelli]